MLQPAGVMGFGQTGHPLAGGREQHPVPGLTRPDRDTDRQMGLAGARRAEEHDVVFGDHEVQCPEVGDGVAFESVGVVEVELLQ